MAAISWETVENAIQAWVSATSGIPGNRCIWTYQGGKVPGLPYVALQIGATRGVGQAWKNKRYDSGEDAIVVKVRQHQMATLQVQLFSDEKSGREPIEKLTDVVAGVDLHEYELDEGGVGIGDFSPVQFIPPINKSVVLEGSAIFTADIHLASELEARESYLKRWQTTYTADTIVVASGWTPMSQSFSSGFGPGFEVSNG